MFFKNTYWTADKLCEIDKSHLTPESKNMWKSKGFKRLNR